MNQYCFTIKNPSNIVIDYEKLKIRIQNLYITLIVDNNTLPFNIINSIPDSTICIVLTSTKKKIINDIEKIHERMPIEGFDFGGIHISKPILFAIDIHNWWEDNGNKNIKWTSLVHNGPYFPSIMNPYERLNATLIYNNIRYNNLTDEEEKVLRYYAERKFRESEEKVSKRL